MEIIPVAQELIGKIDPAILDAAAKGIATAIGKVARETGIKLLGNTNSKLLDSAGNLTKAAQDLLFLISRKYVENYTERHGTLKVLGMRKPVSLDYVYTKVNFQADTIRSYQSLDAQEEVFRQREKRDQEKLPGLDIANQKQYLMVLGNPGTGKTTFLRKVGLEALKGKGKGEYQHNCIPVLLELRKFRSGEIDLVQAIASEFENCGLPEYQECTEKLLEKGRLLILLDGLDEVPSDRLNAMTTQIRDLLDRYSGNRFIVSCRIAAYRNFDNFRRFTDVAIADFDDEQIETFISKWFESHSQPEWGQQCWEKLNSGDHNATKELTRTPLLLTLICILFKKRGEFPNKRATVYNEALWTLLSEWDASKEIVRQQLYKGMDTKVQELMLAEIAYNFFVADNLFMSKEELVNCIEQILYELSPETNFIDGLAVLKEIEYQHGILIERAEGTYSFSNLSLQEFLVAKYIADNDIVRNTVEIYINNRRWHEVFIIISGLRRADEYLLQIENIINQYLKNYKVKSLVYWSTQVAMNSNTEILSSLKRAIAIFWAMNFKFEPVLKFIEFLSPDIYKEFTNKNINNAQYDFLLEKVKYYLNLDNFQEKIDFAFSPEEILELDNYFYLNLLLLESRKSAIRFSRETWNIIEQRLLRLDNDPNIRTLETSKKFFEKIGAKIIQKTELFAQIESVLNGLSIPVPIPIFPTKKLTAHLVAKFANYCKLNTDNNNNNAGILLYQEPPDTLARMRIAEVRLSEKIKLIPIPLAEVENALTDENSLCRSILTEYVNRYMGRADFFDDKNAISDTLSFFGRTDLLHKLEEELLRYQGVGLFGMRKSGKTSVIFQLGFLLREHPVIHIDLQRYGDSNYGADLFNYIIQQISKLASERIFDNIPKFDDFIPGTPAKELSVEFINRISVLSETLSIAKYKLPIICLLDEIERIFPTHLDSRAKVEEFNAFFGALRVLSQNQHRKLSLLVADVNPDCNRINHWSQEDVPTNPVFKFFKEIFLSPFVEDETIEMITSIGKLMGLDFDNNVLLEIHRESGGHPFVARQIARLLCQDPYHKKGSIVSCTLTPEDWENLLFDHEDLNNYFEESIWGNYKKRNSEAEMMILKILATNETTHKYLQEKILLNKLSRNFSRTQCRKAINSLLTIGLIEREKKQNNNLYKIQMPHFLRWLQMQMS